MKGRSILMRNIGKAVSVLLMAAMIVTLVPGLLWAGAETGSGGIVPTNPNAPGTKVAGPVTIFYELQEDAINCPAALGNARITRFAVVMQLTKGNTLLTFSGESVPSTTLCSPGITEQVNFVKSLIEGKVLPAFFGGLTVPALAYDFKGLTPPSPSQSQDFGTESSPTTTDAVSMIMTLAVH
jgi:hypothetical protein